MAYLILTGVLAEAVVTNSYLLVTPLTRATELEFMIVFSIFVPGGEKKQNIKLLAIIHPTFWYRATESSCCALGKRFIWWLFNNI